MTYIKDKAIEVIKFVQSKGLEVRFSSEDSFRSDLVDLLSLYKAVNEVGVNRVGIADTVGCATPRQVYDLVRTLRGVVNCDIETHFHVSAPNPPYRFATCIYNADWCVSETGTGLTWSLERHWMCDC